MVRNEEYFATAAQIIPVLALAALGQIAVRTGRAGARLDLHSALLLLSQLASLVYTEAVAMGALLGRPLPGAEDQVAIGLGLVGTLLLIEVTRDLVPTLLDAPKEVRAALLVLDGVVTLSPLLFAGQYAYLAT